MSMIAFTQLNSCIIFYSCWGLGYVHLWETLLSLLYLPKQILMKIWNRKYVNEIDICVYTIAKIRIQFKNVIGYLILKIFIRNCVLVLKYKNKEKRQTRRKVYEINQFYTQFYMFNTNITSVCSYLLPSTSISSYGEGQHIFFHMLHK